MSISVVMISLTLKRAFSEPAMPPHSAPASGARDDHQGPRTKGERAGRHDRAQHHRGGAPGAQQQLALGADVPQPHPERERTGEPVKMSGVALTSVSESTPEVAERRPTMCW